MSNKINEIIGSQILDFVEIYDYKQIITNKETINLYNPIKCYSQSNAAIKFDDLINDFLNTTITKVFIKSNEFLELEISDKLYIQISLKDSDYSGIEAVSIYFKCGEILVFH